ncbi:unnamed protein product [Caenorhabditis bovis]|uniref:Uncharacterized protein n=1 Tax=Caenorhabditis bovis TaxID=2654633 RepID=A0A8S1EIP3_9PELO|nr:unnamed protein product [Caenorhabditis bovis]
MRRDVHKFSPKSLIKKSFRLFRYKKDDEFFIKEQVSTIRSTLKKKKSVYTQEIGTLSNIIRSSLNFRNENNSQLLNWIADILKDIHISEPSYVSPDIPATRSCAYLSASSCVDNIDGQIRDDRSIKTDMENMHNHLEFTTAMEIYESASYAPDTNSPTRDLTGFYKVEIDSESDHSFDSSSIRNVLSLESLDRSFADCKTERKMQSEEMPAHYKLYGEQNKPSQEQNDNSTYGLSSTINDEPISKKRSSYKGHELNSSFWLEQSPDYQLYGFPKDRNSLYDVDISDVCYDTEFLINFYKDRKKQQSVPRSDSVSRYQPDLSSAQISNESCDIKEDFKEDFMINKWNSSYAETSVKVGSKETRKNCDVSENVSHIKKRNNDFQGDSNSSVNVTDSTYDETTFMEIEEISDFSLHSKTVGLDYSDDDRSVIMDLDITPPSYQASGFVQNVSGKLSANRKSNSHKNQLKNSHVNTNIDEYSSNNEKFVQSTEHSVRGFFKNKWLRNRNGEENLREMQFEQVSSANDQDSKTSLNNANKNPNDLVINKGCWYIDKSGQPYQEPEQKVKKECGAPATSFSNTTTVEPKKNRKNNEHKTEQTIAKPTLFYFQRIPRSDNSNQPFKYRRSEDHEHQSNERNTKELIVGQNQKQINHGFAPTKVAHFPNQMHH